MSKKSLLSMLFAGALCGQVFAIDDTPFKISNTLRFGYDDNPYSVHNRDDSFFVEDIIDLAFRASLSDRTDLMLKAQLRAEVDEEDESLYPNFFGTLNHAFSSRLFVSLSETFKTADRNGSANIKKPNKKERIDYWQNIIGLNADYVLNQKHQIGVNGTHVIERNDSKADVYDFTRYVAGASWSYALKPQQTRFTVMAQHVKVDYDEVHSKYNQEVLYGELAHTFNPNWKGTVKGGLTYTDRDFAESDSTTDPLFGAGLIFSPSPKTSIDASVDYQYEQTENSSYGGRTATTVRLGIDHELTAKMRVKSNVRFVDSDYEKKDLDKNGLADGSGGEEHWYFNARLSYKLNRTHSIETGYSYSQKDRDGVQNADWRRHRVDVGWRVDL
ncbi:MAG: outer membrane beta-barrel protein [Kiritimatiellales bacterium]